MLTEKLYNFGIDSDMDEFDESDDLDDLDEDFDDDDFDDEDEDEDFDDTSEQNLMDLEELGVMDGQQDGISGSYYAGFGMSVDFDELSFEEQEAYEMGYHTGFGASGGF